MAKKSPKELVELDQELFKNHGPVNTLWQTLAEHFYPERADFSVRRNVGQELADSLVDSYPILVRRDLGNSFSAMLRDGDWFKVGINGEPDHAGQMWLDWASQRLYKLMYHRQANFVRATKEGDHDYATFGQACLTVQRNRRADGPLFQCWHLRDCAWFDDENGQVGGVTRRWSPTYHQMVSFFGDKCHDEVRTQAPKKPFSKGDVRHMVLPAEMYDPELADKGTPWVALFVDVHHQTILEEVPMDYMMYVLPRFQTIAGSPYAYSPATVVGLPDARTLQAMTHTLLEAGERYARPPLIGTQKVVRGDVDLSPDGITWVDKEYDERLGAALQPLKQDRGGFPIGLELREGIVDVLASAFYINKLTLPEVTRDMTAYEVAERMKQYRRENLPLFAPIEAEYNGQLCETAFELCMQNGWLGSPYDIPESLQGADIEFKFESPLTASEEEEKANRFQQMSQMLAEAAQLDQNVIQNVDFDGAFRDAVVGLGAPAKWLHSMEEVMAGRQQANQQAQMVQGAEMAQMMGDAAQSMEAAANG